MKVKLDEIIKEADIDGEGREIMKVKLDEMIKEADVDGDGRINYEG